MAEKQLEKEAYEQQIAAGKSHEYAKAYASKVHEGEVFARHFAAIRFITITKKKNRKRKRQKERKKEKRKKERRNGRKNREKGGTLLRMYARGASVFELDRWQLDWTGPKQEAQEMN